MRCSKTGLDFLNSSDVSVEGLGEDIVVNSIGEHRGREGDGAGVGAGEGGDSGGGDGGGVGIELKVDQSLGEDEEVADLEGLREELILGVHEAHGEAAL